MTVICQPPFGTPSFSLQWPHFPLNSQELLAYHLLSTQSSAIHPARQINLFSKVSGPNVRRTVE